MSRRAPRRKVNGQELLVVDLRFQGPLGVERYRRAAEVQSQQGVRDETARVQAYHRQHGTISPLLRAGKGRAGKVWTPPSAPLPGPVAAKGGTWADAVSYYRENEMPRLQASTRRGYDNALRGPWLKHWEAYPLHTITCRRIQEWDAKQVLAELAPSSRRNHQIVLRSVLRSVGPILDEPGIYLDKLPVFPPLPKVGATQVQVVDEESLLALLGPRPTGFHHRTWEMFHLAVMLAAYCGLRASEIRALRRRDIDLENEIITVRLKRCSGVEAPPKSGDERTIDFLAPALKARLESRLVDLKAEDYVVVSSRGGPLGDHALTKSFHRACKALKLDGARAHRLRHTFTTALFGAGVDPRTVQELLGHQSLEVTMRYAHSNRLRKKAAGRAFGCVS